MDKYVPSSSSDMISTWWKSFWTIKIPRKIQIFAWRGYHEILPTTKGLERRNVHFHSNCPLCGFGKDSKVPFLARILGHKEDISFKGVLLYATKLLEKEDFSKLLLTSWGIWNGRNKKTHGQQ